MVTRKVVAAYIAASFFSIVAFLADYANTYRAFYPAMVALANSSAFRLLTVNGIVASTILVWVAMQLLFFGKLNASEETALLTSFTVYLAECIVVPLYFDLTLMSTTMIFFAFTLVWRLLHKLAAERVTTLSTMQITFTAITRMAFYLNVVLIADAAFLLYLVRSRPELGTERASLHYSLLLIYILLITSSLRTTVRFAGLFVLQDQHTWLPFVADAVTSIAESLLFVGIYAYIFVKSTLPLLLLRGFVGHVLRIFEKTSALAEFIVLARRVRHDMPDATVADLERDARCTICYEDMQPGGGTKRLPCGHCYHTDCLEHWLEGHATCPYCRANIMRMPAPTAAAAQAQEAAAAAPPVEPAPAPLPAPVQPMDAAAARELRRRGEVVHREGHVPPEVEAELLAAYQQYLQRAQSPVAEERTGIATVAPIAPVTVPKVHHRSQETRPSVPSRRTSTPPLPIAPAAAVEAEDEEEGMPADVVPPAPSPPSMGTTATSTAPVRTIDLMKLKAYRRYHRRLREAEKELQMALRSVEEAGGAV